MTRGRLFALGLGPGDPDLITVRARSILQHAPTLFVPVRRPGGRSYVLDIVSGLIDTSRQRVEVLPFPAGTWQEHVAKIVDELGRGDAAFLTEGDPLF